MTRHTVEDYRSCSEKGMTVQQAARHLGVARCTATHMSQRHGFKFAGGEVGRHPKDVTSKVRGMDTRAEIVSMLNKPLTANDIATRLRITASAARNQLCKLQEMGIVRVVEVIENTKIYELDRKAQVAA